MDLAYKVVLIGDSGVGKTAIISMKTRKSFDAETPPTVGSLTQSTTISIDGQQVTLNLWDTAGQERYQSLTKSFLHDTKVAIAVADISNPLTIDHLDSWVNLLYECSPKAQIVVALNKSDLAIHNQALIRDARVKLIHKYENIMTVSALTGSNIQELFDVVGSIALKNTQAQSDADQLQKRSSGGSGCC